MTLPEIAYDLLETIRNANIVDDEHIDQRLLWNWIHNQRALWIKRKSDSIKDYDDNLIQTIVVGLEKVNSSIVPNLPSENTLLRTVIQIPTTIELNYGNAILEVTSPDLNDKEFLYVPFNQLRFSGNGKYNKGNFFVAIRDKYYYVKKGTECNQIIKNIVIRAIFQNPTEVPGYDFETTQYPINNHLIIYLKDMIIKNDLRTILVTNSDTTNNANGVIQN